MNIGKVMYQSALFGDFREVLPTPEKITLLMEAFKDKGFIPSTFLDFDPLYPNPVNRISFISENNEWRMNIGNQRIDIYKNSLNIIGDNLGEMQQFVIECADIFARFLSKFDKKGNRIALVGNYFFNDTNTEKYNSFYLKLRNSYGIYKNVVPFEWNIRDVVKKSIKQENHEEVFNVGTALDRFQGQIFNNNETIFVDRINLLFDINSIPENIEPRYDINKIIWSLNTTCSILSSFLTDIKNLQE